MYSLIKAGKFRFFLGCNFNLIIRIRLDDNDKLSREQLNIINYIIFIRTGINGITDNYDMPLLFINNLSVMISGDLDGKGRLGFITFFSNTEVSDPS